MKYPCKLLLGLTSAFLLYPATSAWGNCADSIASLDVVQPYMERHFSQLQQQDSFPWGDVQPFDTIEENRITLTPAFDTLSGTAKQQVLDSLYLTYNNNWFDLLTPTEQDAALQSGGIGAMSPYEVYASDGRAVALPYDGCTRTILLTEKARYSWYYNRPPSQAQSNPVALRNVGNPSWRDVRYSITTTEEELIRLRFWDTVGYSQAQQGWWIAWIPEQGYFEINVPPDYAEGHLQRFLQIAPNQYDYVVVTTEGTQL